MDGVEDLAMRLLMVPMMVVSLVGGQHGPVAIAAYAAVLSVPVWIACYWLVR